MFLQSIGWALLGALLFGIGLRRRGNAGVPSQPMPPAETTEPDSEAPDAPLPPEDVLEDIRLKLGDLRSRQSDADETIRILREELASKNTDLARLRMGYEFHNRKMLLIQIIHIFRVIDEDLREGRDLQTALQGARLELEGCFEAHGIIVHHPEVGAPFIGARGIDQRHMTTIPAEDPTKRGTIAAVLSPAYFMTGPQGHEELLVPARIRAFV
jgi:hypothetical protein